MFEMHIEDLTHLGGPMGTEKTLTIKRRFFNYEDKAYDAAYWYIRRHTACHIPTKVEKWRKLSYTTRNNMMRDMGHIGITIKKIRVE